MEFPINIEFQDNTLTFETFENLTSFITDLQTNITNLEKREKEMQEKITLLQKDNKILKKELEIEENSHRQTTQIARRKVAESLVS